MDHNVDYKELYLLLFRAATKALDAMQNQNFGLARQILVQAQQDAEELYISAEA